MLTFPARSVLVRAAAAFVVAGALTLPSVPAHAQDTRSLVDQIERLRRDVDVLQRQLARSGVPVSSSAASAGPSSVDGVSTSFVAQTDARFADLDTQLRDLTGRVEELTYQVGQLTSRLDKLVGDVDYRLGALERGAPAAAANAASAPGAAQAAPGEPRLALVPGGPGAAPGPSNAASAATPAAAVAPQAASPEAQYELAYAQLLKAQREQGDFGRAEVALKDFLATHPSHRLAGNAQYWLGETYYVRRDYQSAAGAFAEGFKRYPDSDKAPDNLLKLGMSLGHLNRKADACGTLAELERRYPQASVSIRQATQREKQRLGCG